MAANTFEAIATVTVTGTQTSLDFISIPAAYTDLVIYISPHTNRSGYINSDLVLEINASTSYGIKSVYTTAGSPTQSTGVLALIQGGNDGAFTGQANMFAPTTIYIPNYGSSNQKILTIDYTAEGNTTDQDQARIGFSAALRNDTTAITSIKMKLNSASFTQYTTATLYGIKKYS
jgi:hypothetical protein